MDEKHLSQRLITVASFIPAGARLADIGSDHAYLPVALALKRQISFAVAGEVAQGPYDNMTHEIASHGLTGMIKSRLADGLAAIKPSDRIDTVVIAGMGGTLITKILTAGQTQLVGVHRLVLQPNVGAPCLRQWLMNHHYQILAERILTEDDHIYEVIMAEPSVVPFRYSDYELTFGPFLLEEKGPVFAAKWREYYRRQVKVINQMKQAQKVPVKRIQELNVKLAMVKEALKDDDGK